MKMPEYWPTGGTAVVASSSSRSALSEHYSARATSKEMRLLALRREVEPTVAASGSELCQTNLEHNSNQALI